MGFPYRRKITIYGSLDFGPSIILNDDMEGTLKWDNRGSGGATLIKTNTKCYTGDNSTRARSDTAVIAMGDTLGASRNIILRPGGIIRLNLLIRQSHADTKYTLEWKIDYIHNGRLYTASVTYFTSQEAWLYLDADGNYQIIPNISHILANDKWHFLELVIDTRTHKFISFSIDNALSSLTDIPYQNTVDAAHPYSKMTILGTLTVGVTNYMTMWIDNVSIITE